MKKIISFAFALVIIFSFVGCGSVSGENKDGINSAPIQASTPKPTAIPTPAPTPTPDPRIAMREEYSKQIDEAVANSGVKLVATGEVRNDEIQPMDNGKVYVLKRYTYNNYNMVLVYVGEVVPLTVYVADANLKTVVDLACSFAPIVDETMIGQPKNVLNFKYADLDMDFNTNKLTQYYTYYNSTACIRTEIGDDSDNCVLMMLVSPNE